MATGRRRPSGVGTWSMTRSAAHRRHRRTHRVSTLLAALGIALLASCTNATAGAPHPGRVYPLHTGIIATTFWVGEIFDANASDGSQVVSTYDSRWAAHYGGCDGIMVHGVCGTETRSARNGYFPTAMTAKENPF